MADSYFHFDASRFVIDSHRGAFMEGLLENSIPAFKQSLREGANVLECDLRITKDKKIVLIHNRTIDHIASFARVVPEQDEFNELPRGPVKEHTLAYLKSLKFENNAEILELSEFLEFLSKYKVGAQIELKEAGYEDLILREFEKQEIPYDELLGPIVCTSFNYLLIRKIIKKAMKSSIQLYTHKGDPGLAFGFQAISIGAFYGKYFLKQFQKLQIWGGMTHHRFMPIHKIELAHKYGVKFCPRVPNDEDLIRRYIRAGVDGFETDNVPFIRKIAEEEGIELFPPLNI